MLQKREASAEESTARRLKCMQCAATPTSNRDDDSLWQEVAETRNDTTESTNEASSTAKEIENKGRHTDTERKQTPPSLPLLEDPAFILVFPGRVNDGDRNDKPKSFSSQSRKRRPKLRIRPVAFPRSNQARMREENAAQTGKYSSLKGNYSAKTKVAGVGCPDLVCFPNLAAEFKDIERPVKNQVSTPRPNLRILPAKRRIEPRFEQRDGEMLQLSRRSLSKHIETDRSLSLDRLSIPIL